MIEYVKKDESHESESGNIEGKTINSKSKKQMTSFDLEMLKLLKQSLIERPPIHLPREWQDEDYLRILKYCDFEIQVSIDILLEHLDWRKSVEITKIPNQLVNFNFTQVEGVIYFNGHDKHNYPVMVINIERAMQSTFMKFETTLQFIMTIVIRDCNIEQMTLLIDSSTLSFKKDFLKKAFINFIQQTEKHCYDRFHRIILLIDQFDDYTLPLKPSTKEKLTIIKNENLINLHKYIHPKMLESKYLGQQSDIKNNFWPPKLNPKNSESRSLLQFEESNYLQSRQRDCSSSKLMLQVHNEEQEVILSESHLIEIPDNYMEDALDQNSNSAKSNCFQSSQRMQISDTTPLQSTTMKQKEKPFQFQESCMSSEYMNSDLILQSLNERECCKESSCQLI